MPVFLGHSYADRTMSYSLGDAASHKPARYEQYCTDAGLAFASNEHDKLETKAMSLGLIGTILIIVVILMLLGRL